MTKCLKVLFVLAAVLAPRCVPGDAVAVFDRAREGVVTIVATDGGRQRSVPAPFFEGERSYGRVLGSGVLLADGRIAAGKELVLTANHVVAGTKQFAVVFWDLTEVPGELVAAEPRLDIAVVKVASKKGTPLPWRTAEPLQVGESVFAIGTPAVFSEDLTPSVSHGIISALGRTIETVPQEGQRIFLTDLVETDAQVSPGESGGALIDSRGKLAGMCLALYRPLGAARGRAYAIPADGWLARSVKELIENGEVRIGFFGVRVEPLVMERARRLGVAARSGVQVSRVEEGAPFAEAGIKVGDIVMRVAGRRVRRTTLFRQVEMRQEPGSTVRVRIMRPGKREPFDVDVTVAAAGAEHEQEEFSWRGMRLAPLCDAMRREFGMHYHEGVVVMDIVPNGNAYRAGLRRGDVIVEINNVTVRTLDDFRAAVAKIPAANVVRVRTTTGIGHIRGETRTK